LAYLREKGKEFDKMEAEALAAQAARGRATSESSCNTAGGLDGPGIFERRLLSIRTSKRRALVAIGYFHVIRSPPKSFFLSFHIHKIRLAFLQGIVLF